MHKPTGWTGEFNPHFLIGLVGVRLENSHGAVRCGLTKELSRLDCVRKLCQHHAMWAGLGWVLPQFSALRVTAKRLFLKFSLVFEGLPPPLLLLLLIYAWWILDRVWVGIKKNVLSPKSWYMWTVSLANYVHNYCFQILICIWHNYVNCIHKSELVYMRNVRLSVRSVWL